MARNRDPFTLALSSLRERILSGLLASGSPVVVLDEAERLRLSATPVREALARLSGEGLVERAPSGGYVTLRLDAASTRDRYVMQAQYLRFAIDLNRMALGDVRPPSPTRDLAEPMAMIDRLFSSIICSAGNHVLWGAFEQVRGQLDLVRRLEPLLFDDIEGEAHRLYDAYTADAQNGLHRELDRYHGRRIAGSGALVALTMTRVPASSAGERFG